MIDHPPKKVCCDDFFKAQQEGTDCEGIGPLVSQERYQVWVIGYDVPPIAFCPWCGECLL